MRRVVTASQEPAYRFCLRCGKELVREVTVVGAAVTKMDEPEAVLYQRFEAFKKPLLTPYCAYQTAHERGEEVR